MEEEIIQLEKQVQSLIDWKNSRKKERLVLPLDVLSKRALESWSVQGKNLVNNGVTSSNGLFKFTGKVLNQDYVSVLTTLMILPIEVLINGGIPVFPDTEGVLPGTVHCVAMGLKIYPFTVNTITDIITNTNGQHNLSNDQIITVTTSGTLPSPLLTNTFYYIINRTGNTFQVSLSKGGLPVNITTVGVGTHYYAIIQ